MRAFDKRQDVGLEEGDVAVVDGVVLDAALGHGHFLIDVAAEHARVHEHGDRRRDLARVGERVEHRDRAYRAIAVEVAATIVEDDQRGLSHARGMPLALPG